MATQPDLVGTVTLTSGSTAFTWAGTSLVAAAIQAGDEIRLPGKAMVLTIATVTSATEGTLTDNCPAGAAGSGQAARVRYQSDLSRVAAQTRQLIELLSGRGFFKYDAAGSLAERDDYDTRQQGFAYLNIDTDPMELYVKASDDSGDWAGPVSYATGPTGPAPNMAVGTTDTGAAGTDADVTIDGTNPNYTLNFTIPRGDTGAQGPLGPAGFRVSAVGELADRSTYDAEDAGFSFVATDGDGVSITEPVVFVKLSAVSADWSDAVAFGASAIGSMAESVYDADEIGMDVFGGGIRTATRAALASATVAASVDYVQTVGYAAAGDGGGALYRRVGSEPAHAGKVQSADGAWWELAERVVTPAMFGAAGDGVADDSEPLQNAITTSYGRALESPPGKVYRITSSLSAVDNVAIDFNGSTIDAAELEAGTSLNQIRALVLSGSIEDAVSVTSNVILHATSLTVSSTTGISVGDVLLLQSDQLMVADYGNPATTRGELVRVRAIDSTTQLTLHGSTSFQYLSASNARIRKVNTIQPRISNLSIVCGGVGKAHSGLAFDYCEDFVCENVSVDMAEDSGIQTWYCYRGRISGGNIENCTSPTEIPGGNSGYGVVLYNATRDVEIDGVSFSNCQRSVTGGGGLPAIYCTTQNCYVYGGLNGLGTHEPCWWWTIQDNTIVGVAENGLQLRGQYTKVYRNKIVGSGICGMRVRTFVTNPNGITGIEIVGNEVINSGSLGIWIDGDATNGPVRKVQITGGSIRNSGENNIYGRRCSDVTIIGVELDGQTIANTIDGNGILFNGSSTSGDRCSGITVHAVRVPTSLRSGMHFRYCDDIKVSQSDVRAAVAHALRFTFCERVTVNGGFYEATGTDFVHGIYYENTNNTETTGATFRGSTARSGTHGVVCQGTSTNNCLDHVIVGNTMIDFVKAVLVTGTNANHTVAVGNNGRSCSSGTKFDVSGANQSVANNLS